MAANLKRHLVFAVVIILLSLTALYLKHKNDFIFKTCSRKEERETTQFSHLFLWLMPSWIKTESTLNSTPDSPNCPSSLAEFLLQILYFHAIEDCMQGIDIIRELVMKYSDYTYLVAANISKLINKHSILFFAGFSVSFLAIIILRSFITKRSQQEYSTCRKLRNYTNSDFVSIRRGADEKSTDNAREIKGDTRLTSIVESIKSDHCDFKSAFWSPYILMVYVLLALICFSIPWEFMRLYQTAVGNRAAVASAGLPSECRPEGLTLFQTLRLWLSQHLSWSHGNPCDHYYYTLFVDPLWEITPLMVLLSAMTRCIIHPTEMLFSGLGRGLKKFFSEIPAQWQPLFMMLLIVTILVILVMMCSYRVTIPLLFHIGPKTPVLQNNSLCPKKGTRHRVEKQTFGTQNEHSCLSLTSELEKNESLVTPVLPRASLKDYAGSSYSGARSLLFNDNSSTAFREAGPSSNTCNTYRTQNSKQRKTKRVKNN